ncbi:MAG: hypothetical protein GY775_19940 [Candidatus Scalindua sp.]|nr:hypothetical protein [Candidatus Scalindua sp.]
MIRHVIKSKNGETKNVSLTPLKAIRHQCLECMGFSAFEVKRCSNTLCPLSPYRFGTNPERIGIGNHSAKSPAEFRK